MDRRFVLWRRANTVAFVVMVSTCLVAGLYALVRSIHDYGLGPTVSLLSWLAVVPLAIALVSILVRSVRSRSFVQDWWVSVPLALGFPLALFGVELMAVPPWGPYVFVVGFSTIVSMIFCSLSQHLDRTRHRP